MMYSGALSICLSLALLVTLYVMFRDFWVDSIRNDLFELRDEMFLYACENGLLQHPSYLFARTLMNSVIRYAHEISLFRFSLLIAADVAMGAHKRAAPQMLAFHKSLKNLPASQAGKIEEFHTRLLILIGKQVFKTSMLLRFVAAMLDVVLWFARGNGSAEHAMADRMPLELIEQDALAACA